MAEEQYRGNKIEVTRPRGKNRLAVSGKAIGTYTDEELAAGVSAEYSYVPATDLSRCIDARGGHGSLTTESPVHQVGQARPRLPRC